MVQQGLLNVVCCCNRDAYYTLEGLTEALSCLESAQIMSQMRCHALNCGGSFVSYQALTVMVKLYLQCHSENMCLVASASPGIRMVYLD